MKKFIRWTCYALLILLGGLAGRAFVVYSMTGHFGLNKPNYANTNFTYTDVNFGWIKTILPFSLHEDKQNASYIKDMANQTQQDLVTEVKMYTGTYNSRKFALALEKITYSPTVKIDSLGALVGTIAGAGFTTAAQHAAKEAKPLQENGSIKYLYQATTRLNNIPAVFGAVVCVKGNQSIILFGNGNDLPQNKEIINNILKETVCFPQDK